MEDLPVIDLAPFLAHRDAPTGQADVVELCKQLACTLEHTSCLIVRDPRVSASQNSVFLDMMEKYFSQPDEEKAKDERPELSYQVGHTPAARELPRDHSELAKKIGAHIPKGPDPKCRFFWRIGERAPSSRFPGLNADDVTPAAFPEWRETCNMWGNQMLESVLTVSEMLAVGLDLPQDTFKSLLKFGPHLLAPTGTDLQRNGTLGTILAGLHYDLGFLTIHGKSRFPGLYIWTREGKRVLVRVPEGCLLLQAAKQLEWLTAGKITAGFHEVVITPETVEAMERARAEGRCMWRVSTTLFSHMASDSTLAPLPQFATEESAAKYPSMLTGDHMIQELRQIKLGCCVEK